MCDVSTHKTNLFPIALLLWNNRPLQILHKIQGDHSQNVRNEVN